MAGKKTTPKKKPTVKQQKFIELYAQSGNATDAAKRAGYSPKTARQIACNSLTNIYISTAVQERINRALNNSQVTVEEVVGGSVRQMRSSIDDVLDSEGSFSIEKARETGAIDFTKKLKETTRSTYNPATGETQTTKVVEVEMLTNQDGRKEVAGYMELAKNKSDLNKKIELVVKFIDNCFSDLEQKAADDPNETFEFTRREVIEIFCLKCDVSPELVAPLVRECNLLED